jgi:DNA invertase Pin-like site-specific DNA recombinase
MSPLDNRKFDRLVGRSVQNRMNLMKLPQSRGVGFDSLIEHMDATTPGGILIVKVFAAVIALFALNLG